MKIPPLKSLKVGAVFLGGGVWITVIHTVAAVALEEWGWRPLAAVTGAMSIMGGIMAMIGAVVIILSIVDAFELSAADPTPPTGAP